MGLLTANGELKKLVSLMRSLGIVQLGTVVLGPPPAPIAPPPSPEAEAESLRQTKRAEFREEWELQFGHTGSCPFSDEQIDLILTGRVRA